MQKKRYELNKRNERLSVLFNVEDKHLDENNFYVEVIVVNDATEVWLHFDCGCGFVYPKELMAVIPDNYDEVFFEKLILTNIDVWKKTYGDSYLKDEWLY